MAEIEVARTVTNPVEKFGAAVATWLSQKEVFKDTVLTVVASLAAYQVTGDVGLSAGIGIAVGNLIPPAWRQTANRANAETTNNAHLYEKRDTRPYIQRLASALKTGRIDRSQSDYVENEKPPRKD